MYWWIDKCEHTGMWKDHLQIKDVQTIEIKVAAEEGVDLSKG